MARTSGHGNPNWTKDETILALDLYFDLGGKVPSGADKRVKALSETLRRLPYHAEAARRESFRNPDGVAFKLQNLRQVATGKGLGNVSEMDRQVWAVFGESAEKTKSAADLIREGIDASASLPDSDSDPEFVEGKLITQIHSRRERDPKLRQKLLEARMKTSSLHCDMCGTLPLAKNTEYQDAQYEAHHVVPLSHLGVTKTRLSDMALLCAGCHRLLHRAISKEKRWLTVSEGRAICGIDFSSNKT